MQYGELPFSFWLVLTYDILEDRYKDDIINILCYFYDINKSNHNNGLSNHNFTLKTFETKN